MTALFLILAVLAFAETAFAETAFAETAFADTAFAETAFAETAFAETAFAETVEAAATCPDGWSYYEATDSCYFLSVEYLSYAEATDRCNSFGGTLATPHTIEELRFIGTLLPIDAIWLGLDDIKTEGTYLFQDGQELQYNAWAPGNPTGGTVSNCVIFSPHGFALEDTNCDQAHIYTCQAPSTVPDPCDDVICDNGGVCNSETGAAVCDCQMGYAGERCEEETQVPDPCEDKTCDNGGVCNSASGAAVCDCPKGYAGERCEQKTTTNVQECCAERPCPKGLKCIEVYTSCPPRRIETDIPSYACLPKKCTDCDRKGVCDLKGTRVHCTSREARSVH